MKLFTSYGKVESVEMLVDKQTGKKRGFGFVNFNDYDVVDKVSFTFFNSVLTTSSFRLYRHDVIRSVAFRLRC